MPSDEGGSDASSVLPVTNEASMSCCPPAVTTHITGDDAGCADHSSHPSLNQTLWPQLKVVSDVEGYFGRYVWMLIEKKARSWGSFQSREVVVSASPYRSYNLEYRVESDELFLDFYSGCRLFGGPGAEADVGISHLL